LRQGLARLIRAPGAPDTATWADIDISGLAAAAK
jgi:hypothetical protein